MTLLLFFAPSPPVVLYGVPASAIASAAPPYKLSSIEDYLRASLRELVSEQQFVEGQIATAYSNNDFSLVDAIQNKLSACSIAISEVSRAIGIDDLVRPYAVTPPPGRAKASADSPTVTP